MNNFKEKYLKMGNFVIYGCMFLSVIICILAFSPLIDQGYKFKYMLKYGGIVILIQFTYLLGAFYFEISSKNKIVIKEDNKKKGK